MPSYLKAIRKKCKDCMGNYRDGKVDCMVHGCPLYPFMYFSAENVGKRRAKRDRKGNPDALPVGFRR